MSSSTKTSPGHSLKVALAGIGAIGLKVAVWLDTEAADGLELVAVSARDKDGARRKLAGLSRSPEIMEVRELAAHADIVVECAPPPLFRDVAGPVVEGGKTLVALTATQLLVNEDLVERAKETGARIIVPTGALLGLDAVRAAAEGSIHSIVMRTRKPPAGLKSAPFVVDQGIVLDGLNEAKCLFSGSVRDAAQKFPANVNVSVALALAGVGPDETRYEVWADPEVTRNTHSIKVDADSARFEMSIEGTPTEENPATGKLTPLSVITTLKDMVRTLRVGS